MSSALVATFAASGRAARAELRALAKQCNRLKETNALLMAALSNLADEADRHASHPISDHKHYFVGMAARGRAALAKADALLS